MYFAYHLKIIISTLSILFYLCFLVGSGPDISTYESEKYTGHRLLGDVNGLGLFDSSEKMGSGLSGATKPLVSS